MSVIVYATFPDCQSAQDVGRALVEQQLVACVNLLPGMLSIYRWQGEVETAEEVVMIAKTRAELSDNVVKEIEARHSYDTPAAVTVEIAGGSARYLAWIEEETRDV